MNQPQTDLDPKAMEAIELVVDTVGRLFEDSGYRALVGKVWATLLLMEEAADAATLRRKLGVSSGAMSMTLNELVNHGLVYRHTPPGERRFFYRAESDFWIVAKKVFQNRTHKRLVTMLEEIKKAERIVASHGGTGFYLEQIRRMVNVGEFIIGLLSAIMDRTKVEMKALQKWLIVSEKMGGEPLSRIRRAINTSLLERSRR
jgi:DNA-binding transcriptional regulator GbsR (MarR family)